MKKDKGEGKKQQSLSIQLSHSNHNRYSKNGSFSAGRPQPTLCLRNIKLALNGMGLGYNNYGPLLSNGLI
jgi:hypothetical protein